MISNNNLRDLEFIIENGHYFIGFIEAINNSSLAQKKRLLHKLINKKQYLEKILKENNQRVSEREELIECRARIEYLIKDIKNSFCD